MRHARVRLIALALLTLAVSGCDAAYNLLAGKRAEPRALCRGAEQTNAADSTGTRALGSVYSVVYCNNTTEADTVVRP